MEDRMEETDHEHQGASRYAHLLGENHRRVLSTMLMRLELATWRLEERLRRAAPADLSLTRFTDTLDERQRGELLHLTAQIRQLIGQMVRDYDLEAREDDLARTVTAEFSLLWSDLEDTRPHKLRNYGELEPRARDILGLQIQELVGLVLAIDGATRNKGK
jgi:hypothetical protein